MSYFDIKIQEIENERKRILFLACQLEIFIVLTTKVMHKLQAQAESFSNEISSLHAIMEEMKDQRNQMMYFGHAITDVVKFYANTEFLLIHPSQEEFGASAPMAVYDYTIQTNDTLVKDLPLEDKVTLALRLPIDTTVNIAMEFHHGVEGLALMLDTGFSAVGNKLGLVSDEAYNKNKEVFDNQVAGIKEYANRFKSLDASVNPITVPGYKIIDGFGNFITGNTTYEEQVEYTTNVFDVGASLWGATKILSNGISKISQLTGKNKWTGVKAEEVLTKADDIAEGASKAGNFDAPKLSFNESQLGKKIGKHASDFGLNPSDPSSRQFIRDKITSIVDSPDEVRRNLWMGQGSLGTTGAEGYVNMYIQGNSAVITKLNGEFITILKNYTTNSRVVEAESIWP